MKDVVLDIHFQMTVQEPDDSTDEYIQFKYEENHCMQNLILEEARRIESTPGLCSICCRGEVKVRAP